MFAITYILDLCNNDFLKDEELNGTYFSTLEAATYANRLASTGVLHGEAAKANVSPAKYAWTPFKLFQH